MKKIVLLLVVCVSLFVFTGCMNNSGSGGQVSGGVTNSSNPLYDPDYYYEIDTWGTNADVWEFTPKSNPNYACVNVGANSRSIFCFPKKSK